MNGDFCIEKFTNSSGTGGIEDWTKEKWKLALPQETASWIIRVIGTYFP